MMRDELTGLPASELFGELLEQALARTRRRPTQMAVLVLGIDPLDSGDEELGAKAREELIVQIASRLKEAVRDGDTLAYLGDGEFAVTCEDIESEGHVALIAERLLATTTHPIVLDGAERFMTLSAGVSASEGSAEQSLLELARTAMLVARAQGGARYELDRPLQSRLRRGLALESELRGAIERSELRLYYQPSYRLQEATISSLEAWLRWEHPKRGIVAPAEFISAVEESGLIVELGRWSIEEACRQIAAWRSELEQVELYISVNVSAPQLVRTDVVETLQAAAERSGAPLDNLALELTSDDLSLLPEDNMARLAEVSSIGASLIVEELASGRLPVGRMEQLPLRALRIAAPLIAGLPDDPHSTTLVRASIAVAGALGIETVAQGVESAGQLGALRELGCDSAAGFLLSVPMPPQALSELLVGRVKPLERPEGATSAPEHERD